MKDFIYVIADDHKNIMKYITKDIPVEIVNSLTEKISDSMQINVHAYYIPVLEKQIGEYSQVSVLFADGIPFAAYINSIYEAESNFARLAKNSNNKIEYDRIHDVWSN